MKKISVEHCSAGFRIINDGTQLKTPLGKDIILPNLHTGEAIAAEWLAQGNKIRKETMPLTQIACVAIDLVQEKRSEVYNDILLYADTDMLCYRAGNIPELLALQEKELTPVINWAENKLTLKLNITDGIMPVVQDKEIRSKILNLLRQYNEWQIAILASIVKPLSSILLSLAMLEQLVDSQQAFYLSHLEESYETGKWGADSEKEQRLNKLKQEILSAGEFLKLLLP